MKNNKHTAGPWLVEKHDNEPLSIWSNSEHIAVIPPSLVANRESNAALIAAAPLMLDTLEKASHDLEALRLSSDEADYPLEVVNYLETYMLDLFKTAIAKARGES